MAELWGIIAKHLNALPRATLGKANKHQDNMSTQALPLYGLKSYAQEGFVGGYWEGVTLEACLEFILEDLFFLYFVF